MSTQLLENLDTVFKQYEIFLVDAWGVVHDGVAPCPGGGELLTRRMARGKNVTVLSNAARRIPAFKEELKKVGISPGLYTDAVTSGELSWRALSNLSDSALAGAGRRFYYLGPRRSRGLLDGLTLEEVSKLSEADFIVNTGAEGNQPDASAFEPLLKEALNLNLPMLCANPDRIAIRGGVLGISAGAIAYAYEQLGGKVIVFGKPHPPIYQSCFDMFPGVDSSAFVMLGDGLITDIQGANTAGIDSIFLASGIHQAELSGPEAISQEALFEKHQAWPSYVLQFLPGKS